MLSGKNILLGVTGSIAAYKAAYLVSMLKKAGACADVVMTDAAEKFITPLTFETLSGQAVCSDLFSRQKPFEVEHIALAKKADAAVVAPASANTIAKIAYGIADNLLTSTLLAYKKPIMFAPAMNTAMYENPATVKNLQTLKTRGHIVIEPKSGVLACGDTGKGRMCEPEEIFEHLVYTTRSDKLRGVRILITAGPTREPLDPVRYLTNRSSGKMGYSIAKAAVLMGAEVDLVSGPVNIKPPLGAEVHPVETAEEMFRTTVKFAECADIIVMCAAVADYAPSVYEEQKIKKGADLTLMLEKTPDILEYLGNHKSFYLVGFAAETNDLEQYARDKMEKKNLDMIIANDVSDKKIGFDSDFNEVVILEKSGREIVLERADKDEIARQILTIIADRFNAKSHSNQ